MQVKPARPSLDAKTLRDDFAGQVLAGWGESFHRIAYMLHGREPTAADIAHTAYVVADAMLLERET
jgi:hypothetical protein